MRAASSLLLAPQRTAACSGLSSSARSAPSIREQSLARVRFEQRGKAWSSSPRHFSLTAARQRPNTSPSSPSSSVEYSARTGSPSGSSQKPKVEVLPFALSTQEALDFLRVPATFAALYHSRGFWRAAGYIALRWLFGYGGAAEQEVKLERCRAVFVPTWLVDSSFELKCRGNDGTAAASIFTTRSTFPGHTWKPVTSLLLRPPSELPSDPSTLEPVSAWAPFNKSLHLSPREVHIPDGITLLPFSVSPLLLPDLIRNAHPAKMTLPTTSPTKRGRHVVGPFEIIVERESEDVEDDTGPNIRFDPSSLDVDCFATYPMLIPIHVAQFSYTMEDGSHKEMTHVVEAWHPTKPRVVPLHPIHETWLGQVSSFLDLDAFAFFPRVPSKPEESEESGSSTSGENNTASSASRPKVGIMARAAQDATIETSLRQEAALKCDHLIEIANWDSLEQKEREASLARRSEEKSAEAHRSPDVEAGLGEHIDWNSRHIQRYSLRAEKNQRYILAGASVISARRLVDSTQESGADGQFVKVERVNADGERETLDRKEIGNPDELLAEARQVRESLKPTWLKELHAERAKRAEEAQK